MIGAPHLKSEHYPVFDCAIGERAIHYMGHVKMMGAVQPFISGAISKTVNLPEQTSVDEVAQLLIEAWQLGVKAIAIYRDNCKVAQPLSGSKDTSEEGRIAQIHALGGVVAHPKRRRLPDDRTEVGRKFKVGEYEGYIHVGLFEDGTPGDIFVDIAKEGTTLAGLMNSFMISVSLGLQYGVPLEVYVSKFSHMRFEPSGMTNDADIRIAKSIVDYIFRWMGKKFLTADQQEEAGILTPEVKARLAAAYAAGEAQASPPPRESRAARPDGAVQQLGGRGRVLEVRRPHGAHGQLLHVPRLRHEHRLQLIDDGCAHRGVRDARNRMSAFRHRAVREGGPMISGTQDSRVDRRLSCHDCGRQPSGAVTLASTRGDRRVLPVGWARTGMARRPELGGWSRCARRQRFRGRTPRTSTHFPVRFRRHPAPSGCRVDATGRGRPEPDRIRAGMTERGRRCDRRSYARSRRHGAEGERQRTVAQAAVSPSTTRSTTLPARRPQRLPDARRRRGVHRRPEPARGHGPGRRRGASRASA